MVEPTTLMRAWCLVLQADRHRQPDGLELRVGAVDLHVRAQLVGAVAADLPHEAVGAVDAELDAGGDGGDREVDVHVVVRAQDGGAGPDRRRRPGRFDRGAEARRGCVRGRPVALERAHRPVQAGRVGQRRAAVEDVHRVGRLHLARVPDVAQRARARAHLDLVRVAGAVPPQQRGGGFNRERLCLVLDRQTGRSRRHRGRRTGEHDRGRDQNSPHRP